MTGRQTSIPPDVLSRLRSICASLPETREEQAWVGVRWRIRNHTFAHVLTIESGWPPAYAKVAKTDGPSTVLTFRSSGDELHALASTGPPFFMPGWWPDIVGLAFDAKVDWVEVKELVTESYRLLAPKKLAALVGASAG